MKYKKPKIYDYNNFRQYIHDYHAVRQKSEKKFSRGEFSKLLGLPNTRSFINDVIKGRKVTSNFIERFTNIMEFDKDESQFFRVLVKFNQAENIEERELYFDQLISLNKTPKKIIEKNVYVYYKNWYNSVIRALLNVYEFDGDYSKLAQKVFPKITIKQAKESITLLNDLGLIKKNKHGILKPVDKVLSTGESLKNELLKQSQMQCIDIARKMFFLNNNRAQRVITKTISLSEEGYNRIENKLSKVSSEINSIIHKDEKKADRIYQLNLLLLPHSN